MSKPPPLPLEHPLYPDQKGLPSLSWKALAIETLLILAGLPWIWRGADLWVHYWAWVWNLGR